MRILILDWISSVGGVQKVISSVIPELKKNFDITFLDPYSSEFGKEMCRKYDINNANLPISARNSLGWNNKKSRVFIIIKFGLIYFIYLLKFMKYLNNEKIKLLYVHGKKGIIFSYIVKKILKIDYVYHAHGFNSHKDIGFVFKKAIQNSKSIIAVSNDVKDKLVLAGVEHDKIDVIYNGVNIEKNCMLAKCEPSNINTNDQVFLIGYVGSVQFSKGIHVLIDAVSQLLDENVKCELVIIGEIPPGGDNNYLQFLNQKISSTHQGQIKFLGFQNNVFPHIHSLNVLVLPSIVEESFGLVLIEAMSLRKAVIGSNIGGIPEVIIHEYNGLLIEPNSLQDLYKALKKLIKNPECLLKLGNNGFETVRANYSIIKQSDMISRNFYRIGAGDLPKNFEHE